MTLGRLAAFGSREVENKEDFDSVLHADTQVRYPMLM